MKNILLTTLAAMLMLAATTPALAQKRGKTGKGKTEKGKCPEMVMNLKTGQVNGLKPAASQAEVKARFPCSTGETADGSDFNCGGGVFYINHDIYFYTGKDYIEARGKFAGKTTPVVLGQDVETALQSVSGMSEVVKKNGYVLVAMPYGSLRLDYGDDKKVYQVAIYSAPPASVPNCD